MKSTISKRPTIILLILPFLFFSCKEQKKESAKELIPFSLKDVRLTDSPFMNAMQQNEQWLLSFEPDRFLSGFRSEAGLTPKAPKYGGWESQGVAGQTMGHYLSALSMMYNATGNEELYERIVYTVNELDSCQQAFDLHGLFAAFPRSKELFQEITRGDIRTEGFDLNGGWVPFYNLHKLFAGLTDIWYNTGNQQAYEVLIRLSEGFHHMMAGLSDEQIQKILICEHGGINESMAEMYALTGEEKYIVLAKRLNHQDVLCPLAEGRDELAGKHANTQIPKVVGAIRQFELTGDSTFFNMADFFWNTVVYNHSYVIGGNSEAEHFGVSGRTYDRITDKTCENCNTYNILKLTKHLYMLNPSIEKADYYERALYNQILSSQNPDDGMVCYMSPLAIGSHRHFSTPFDSFWCCVGTGLENHARYGEFIYFTDTDKNLYVNLFIPSILTWEDRSVKLSQQTAFPASDTIYYKIETDQPQNFSLHLRYPGWVKQGVEIAVNGITQTVDVNPGEYIPLSRRWADGDEICFIIPQSITSEAALGDENLRAYLYGPIVLSGIVDENQSVYPVIVTDNTEETNAVITPAGALLFQLNSAEPYKVMMRPYYQTKGDKLMVYFEHYTTDEWKERSKTILDKQNQSQWLEQQTVSSFRPGEMQPERDHNFKGEKFQTGDMQGRKYRKTDTGGWFSFDMDVLPDKEMDLSATFWGDLGDIYKFTIEIDEVPIATVIIHWWGHEFTDKHYHIPFELIKGKEKVTVRFKALDEKSIAGPLFGCKIVKRYAV